MAVRAEPLNDTIALRGAVPSDKVAAQVVEMAGTFAKVHNFTEVAGGQQVNLADPLRRDRPSRPSATWA